MSLTHKAWSAYQRQDLRYLLREGKEYFIWKLIPNKIIWNILPKNKTKRFIAKSKLLTTLFFYIRGSFYYEQKAILEGHAIYNDREEKENKPKHQIVRNVHRLEKGLSMRNRRSVFAEGYISKVVDDVIAAWESDSQLHYDQLCWAIDVLNEYFSVVEDTESITGPRSRFYEFLETVEYEPGDKIPKYRYEIERDVASYEELKHLAGQRTSTRWFQDRNVPRNKIDKALQIAAESPSACNRQSYEFRFYDDEELIDYISELSIGATGYRHNIPCLGVIVGKQRAYFNDRDKHVIYIDASLAAMAFQFGLESLGLSSCCINWPSIPRNDWEIADRLNLEEDEEVIMMMAVGYPDPDGKIPYSAKKDLEELRSYNKIE